MGGHPSRPVVAGGLERSTRRLGRAALERLRRTTSGFPAAVPSRPCSGWGLPSRTGHPVRWWSLTPPFHPHQRRAAGGLFSVALSRGSPRVAVGDHPALWSPDVPRRRGLPRRRDRPADSSVVPASLRTFDGSGRSPRRRRHATPERDTPVATRQLTNRTRFGLSQADNTPTVSASGRSSPPHPGEPCRTPPSRDPPRGREPGTHRTTGVSPASEPARRWVGRNLPPEPVS